MTPPPLRPYQQTAVQFLRERDGAALFLTMGLGKTASSLAALEPRHLPVVVAAPPRVAADTWPEEVPKWRPDLRFAAATGSPAQRRKVLDRMARGELDVVSISWNVLSDIHPYADCVSTLILDELSGFRDHTGERFKAARVLSRVVPYRWGLSGTPSPNGLLGLWAQAYLLDHGKCLGRRYGEFRSTYFREGRRGRTGVVWEWNIRDGAEGTIHARMRSLAMSLETEGKVDLPDFTINAVRVPIPASARRVYQQMTEDMVSTVEMAGGLELFSASTAAVATGRLSQITAGFLYGDPDTRLDGEPAQATDLHDAKLNALAEILEAHTDGTSVLVFCRFRHERERIVERFAPLGAVDVSSVKSDLQGRWNRGEIPILVAHPASIGHGLNLQQGGHVCVWTSLDWSLELWEQANKRLHRPGQTRPVVCHVLEVPDSIDGVIRERLETKASVQDALLRYLSVC